MRLYFLLLVLIFRVSSAEADSPRLHPCLEVEKIDPASMLEIFEVSPEEGKEIFPINAEVTTLKSGECFSREELNEFWVQGGELRSVVIQRKPIFSDEGFCKSQYFSFSGENKNWRNLEERNEGFMVSISSNCLLQPIDQYTNLHALIPDSAVSQLLSYTNLAKNHLSKSEDLDTSEMRVLALGLRAYESSTNYYYWIGLPGSNVWYELPVRLSFNSEQISFYEVATWME